MSGQKVRWTPKPDTLSGASGIARDLRKVKDDAVRRSGGGPSLRRSEPFGLLKGRR